MERNPANSINHGDVCTYTHTSCVSVLLKQSRLYVSQVSYLPTPDRSELPTQLPKSSVHQQLLKVTQVHSELKDCLYSDITISVRGCPVNRCLGVSQGIILASFVYLDGKKHSQWLTMCEIHAFLYTHHVLNFLLIFST